MVRVVVIAGRRRCGLSPATITKSHFSIDLKYRLDKNCVASTNVLHGDVKQQRKL